ncbi:MAG: hypothetical protein HRT71_14955 [Flavobacteriales bacterium]|nr:hypothetical protein [Flavobacteriales bacterium]
MKLTLWISVLVLTLLSSCDCLQTVEGKCVDDKTNKVIVGVVVRLEDDDSDLYDQTKSVGISRKNGVFNVDNMASGVIGCPDIELFFFKEGYLPATVIVAHYTTRKIIKMTKIID